MIKIKAAFNTAIVYADEIEETAREQIRILCEQEEFKDSKIRIMPDVHAGKGCTIGTTMTIKDKVVPNLVGVDIGCGIETTEISETNIDFYKLDNVIRRNIPAGRDIRKSPHEFSKKIDLNHLKCAKHVDIDRAYKSIGSLGGGNHFIELDISKDGNLFLLIHSGSRHIGLEVAMFYQDMAYKNLTKGFNEEFEKTIAILKANGQNKEVKQKQKAKKEEKKKKLSLPKDLSYLKGEMMNDYLHDMKIIQEFANLNRKAITETILKEMNLNKLNAFTTIHNYIDTDEMILRKGAVSAKKGEKFLIPINMKDGSLICIGKGNAEWNTSAPHGAGRIMSRTTAVKKLDMKEYQKEMEGIFTTSINKSTLDEAPMAYKNINQIKNSITDTAEIKSHIKSIYNFKAKE